MKKRSEESLTLELTPLIDIIFILLLFFIVTLSVPSEEKSLPLNLPEVTQGENEVETKEKKIKGESVFIIEGAPDKPPLSNQAIKQKLQKYKESGKISLKDAVKVITAENNLSRSKVYNLALEIWKK